MNFAEAERGKYPTTTVLSRSEPTRRAAEPLRIAGFALAVGAIELLLARGSSSRRSRATSSSSLGLFAVAFVFRFPMATALVSSASPTSSSIPTYFAQELGGLSVRPHELALACLLLVALVRPARRPGAACGCRARGLPRIVLVSGPARPADGRPRSPTPSPGAGRWACSPSSTSWSACSRRPSSAACCYRGRRPRRGHRRRRRGGLVRRTARARPPGGRRPAIREGEGRLDRPRAPRRALGRLRAVLVLRGADRRTARAPRLVWGVLLLASPLDIAISFNRNMWLGLFFGALLMAVFGGAVVRNGWRPVAAVAVAGLAILMVFGSSTAAATSIQPSSTAARRSSTRARPRRKARFRTAPGDR